MIIKAIGILVGIGVGIASIIFAVWQMWIIGAFLAFFLITFGKK